MVRMLVPLALLASTPALAALPPQYQRERELAAVIAAVAAEGHVVDAVTVLPSGVFQVTVGGCTIDARTPSVPAPAGSPPVVGPRQFTVVLEPARCGAAP